MSATLMSRSVDRSHVQEIRRATFRHGLTFYGTFGFVFGFFGARLFATLNPTVTLVDSHSGIHFHHFWYGLVLIIASGWLGIATIEDHLQRNLALVFGLGVGLVGDEVGLLLTFGDYRSELTLWFFVGAVGFISLISLLLGFRKQIEHDVINVSGRQRIVQAGVVIVCLSAIFFEYDNELGGGLTIGLGILVIFAARYWRKRSSLRTLAD